MFRARFYINDTAYRMGSYTFTQDFSNRIIAVSWADEYMKANRIYYYCYDIVEV